VKYTVPGGHRLTDGGDGEAVTLRCLIIFWTITVWAVGGCAELTKFIQVTLGVNLPGNANV